MKILIDTHILVWMWTGDKRLGQDVRDLLSSQKALSKVSIASFWELAIKRSVGKLDLDIALEDLLGSLPEFRLEVLPVAVEHVIAVRDLPLHHRDPFDRMLIAQAKAEGMHILTADPHFGAYEVPLAG